MVALSATALLAWAAPAMPAAAASSPSGIGTVHQSSVKSAHPGSGGAGTAPNLSYHGGVGGVGVETGADRVYIVQWGWTADPSREGARQQAFFQGVGGSTWNNSVTQYCQGVASGTTTCGASATHATNPTAGVYAGTWADNVNTVPRHITQSSLAAEAVRAAAHFPPNTVAGSNNTIQYVIDTPKGHSMNGFGTQWCAWHSSTSSSYGNIAYTNMPYITDAGASCGANFNGLGANAGITIVGGHEFGETETDIFPNGGWLDSGGAENGDKCAWISSGQGASANISLSTGTFAVQSLWSNASNNCVLSYP